jgi:hypothetical protein
MGYNAYNGSDLAAKFGATGRLAVLDVDGTLATANHSEGEIAARGRIVDMLESSGVPYIFSSARTPELMMRLDAYRASHRLGFRRQPPKWGRTPDGVRTYVSPDTLLETRHLCDPDCIISMGTGIYPRRGKGYLPDLSYEERFNPFWRGVTLKYVEDAGLACALAPIEHETAYAMNRVDVETLPYRIQLEFSGPCAMKRKSKAKELLALWGGDIRIIDESKPAEGRYVIYLTPPGASKEAALTHVVGSLCALSERKRSEFSLFIAGDTLTDLPTCDASPESKATYVLPAQSRLSEYVAQNLEFAGESLSFLNSRLVPGDRPGFFSYATEPGVARTFVIADKAGGYRSPAESVEKHLRDWLEE